MRKKTIKFGLDEIMWTIIYMLPVLAYAISLHHNVPTDFGTFMAYFGVITNNPISVALQDIFGTDGILPLFDDGGYLLYFSYFVQVFIIHLAVDFLLFIPRYAHKWLAVLTCNED